MSKVAVLASLVVVVVSVACSSGSTSDTSPTSSAATSQSCVDFIVADDEKACTTASDCTFIDDTHVCSGDPSCGGQVPTNRAGRARYVRETAAISRTQGSCGVPAPEACVAGRCVVCEAAGCPDGG